LYLVVDANVLGHTSHAPIDDQTWKAADILSRILHVCHKIVLDYETGDADSIIAEYRRQAESNPLVQRWLIAMQTRDDKIIYRSRASVHLSVLSDPTDEKYFQVAVNSPHKIIISEDSDLLDIAGDAEVTCKGIVVWGFDEALNHL
jgi:hypothetical protein